MIQKAVEKIKNQAGTNPVLKKIGDHLVQFMKKEPSFAEKILDENKSMSEMLKYIMSEARKQATGNAACIADDEVYGWAVHYFDEKDLKFKPVSGTVAASSSDKTNDKQKPVTQTNKKEKVKEAEVKPETKPEKPKKAKKEAKPDMMISIFDIIGE